MQMFRTIGVWLVVILAAVEVRGQVNGADGAKPQVRVDTTFVLIGQQQWSIQELNAVCLDRLKKEPDWPKNGKFEVVANIMPRDSKTMCEFGFYQQFGQPSWLVEIGYDGKVTKVTKQTVGEGKPKPAKSDP